MSLQGRKSNQSGSAGVDPSASAGATNDGILANLRRSLAPEGGAVSQSAPQRNTIIAVLLGMILGMATAYLVFPIEYTGAAPRQMSPRAVEQWVRMIAVGHNANLQYDDANARLALQQIPDPQSVIARLERDASVSESERSAIAALKDIQGYESLSGAPVPADPGIVVSSLQIIAALLVVAIGVPVLVIIWRQFAPASGSDASDDSHASRQTSAQAELPPRATPRVAPAADPAGQWQQEETEESGGVHPQYGLPVLQSISTYVKGESYDESFAIELGPEAGSQFLGECGLSIATRIGNELQSVEFWGFDMASQETRARIFAAPAAVSDPALIAAVGERVADTTLDIAPATLGAVLLLDTQSIQLQAQIRSVVCNYAGGSPDSGIESMQIEIIAWQKRGAPMQGSAPAGGDPFAQPGEPGFAAPGAMPAPPPAAAGQFDRGGSQPAPAKRPEDEEEDPFGGTGNFMPYS